MGVSEDQLVRLKRILREVRPWVATNLLNIRHTHLLKHRIQLKKGAKTKVQNRKIRLSFKEREWLVGYLAKLEEAQLISRIREAEMSSDIKLAIKLDSADPYRLCINYIYLNSISEKGVGQLRERKVVKRYEMVQRDGNDGIGYKAEIVMTGAGSDGRTWDNWRRAIRGFLLSGKFEGGWISTERARVRRMSRRYRLEEETGRLMLEGFDHVWRAVPSERQISLLYLPKVTGGRICMANDDTGLSPILPVLREVSKSSKSD